MTCLFLIRHGETDWNAEGRWQGQTDIPLNQNGRIQAQKIARELAGEGIQVIYSSDLIRAVETAQALAASTGVQLRLDPRLREIHQGEWQGMLVSEIQSRYTERFELRIQNPLAIAPPGGETVLQVQSRAFQALDEILQKHPQQTVAIVAHGFVLAVIRVHLSGKSMEEVWDLILPSAGWVRYLIG
jgi:broad specificity phosphatase PhoE